MSLYFIKSDFKKDKDGNYSLGVSKASSIFYRVVDSDEGLEALKAAYDALSEDERSSTVEYLYQWQVERYTNENNCELCGKAMLEEDYHFCDICDDCRDK